MARKKYAFTEARIQRFIREGRGQGTGKNYKPWLTVSDVPSLGRSHRIYCPKTGREHHLLSDNEFYAFLCLWWLNEVIDIREQYPCIDRRVTIEVAAHCGVQHPVEPFTGALTVMTTDFLVTLLTENGDELMAISVKQSKDASNYRTLEKLEIERRLWQKNGVPWVILTNKQLKTTFTRNLAWILDAWQSRENDIKIDSAILAELASEQLKQPHVPIGLVLKSIDYKYSLRTGTALTSFRRLLAIKSILVDMHIQSLPELPIEQYMFRGGLG